MIWQSIIFIIKNRIEVKQKSRKRSRKKETKKKQIFNKQITLIIRSRRGWIQCSLKFPFAGCSPTGTHTHVAHTNWCRILPFHDHRTIKTTNSDHDATVKPTNRELLCFVLVQKIWGIYTHLSVQKLIFLYSENSMLLIWPKIWILIF